MFNVLTGRPARRAGLAALGLISILALASGCAAEPEESETSSDELSLGDFLGGGGGFQIGGGGGVTGQAVAGPNGLFTTLVHAKGSGCPRDTWKAGISPDGQTFTITFNAYESRVSPGRSVDQKDCGIDVAIAGTQNLQFAIGTFYYQGYAFLEDRSMTATQSADYSFGPAGLISSFIPGQAGGIAGAIAGMIPGGVSSRNVIRGPADESFTYADDVGIGRWSECAPVANLHINTRLRLENNRPRSGSGYLNNSTVDGALSFGWKLSYRQCTPPPRPENPNPQPDPWSGGAG